MSEPRRAKHWIGGEWIASGTERDSISPANGKVIGSYFDGSVETAQDAIDAAYKAFKQEPWRSDQMLRTTALSHLADAYAARLNDVVDALCAENGKTRHEAAFEASFIIRGLRFAAGLATHTFGRVIDAVPGKQSLSLRQPVCVAGLVIPWNSPAYLAIRALAPALAAGSTAVVKMPHQAARSAQIASEIMASVKELAARAVNLFIESGTEGARLKVDSPIVPVINFTGSTRTGRLIAQGPYLRASIPQTFLS